MPIDGLDILFYLTLTSVVFESKPCPYAVIETINLTLTSVVFELLK